jgi:MEDS: MEthanogen/methylotroph, DcmR Sensory domain
MTVRNRVVRGVPASEHIVQFFDSDESRAEAVAGFLAEGYRHGEPLIVVARPANWTAIVEHLHAADVPVQRLIARETLIVKDANDTLRRLSRNGTPDAAAFEAIISAPVLETARFGRVRAYGEMVDILAQRTDLADAVKLEALWNDLSGRARLYLMCGYSAAHFVATNTHSMLRHICRSHTQVHSSTSDPLAAWLLASAHPGSRDSATLN